MENLRELMLTGSDLIFFVILPIVLWLLKWIGIVALILLCLIVFVVLLVLLVPVRYRVNGAWYKKGIGKVRITWLLHILSITAAYDQKPVFSVRLFGYPVLKPGKNKDELHGEEDFVVQAMEVKELKGGSDQREEEKKPETHKENQRKAEHVKNKTAKIQESKTKPQKNYPDEAKQSHSKNRGIGKWKKKALMLLAKLKDSFKRFCDKLKTIKEKKEEILRVLNNKENQKTVRLLFKQGKKALRHVLPVKGKGRITFGFEDPYLTGQALMAASVAYPFCHKSLEFTPAFDRNVLEGEGAFRGRIRLGTLLVIGLRLLLHKNFRTQLKKCLR